MLPPSRLFPHFGGRRQAPRRRPLPKPLERATRWVQLALVEKDPATFDPDWWLDFFKRVHADGACISAGGVCAFYPTDVPYHHRSDWLGDKDVFGYLVEGCRKQNMAVIARVDPHCIRDDAATAHPEWVAVDAKGQKARHMVMTDRWLTCALGPYNFEFMPQVLREIVKRSTTSMRSSPIAGPATSIATAIRAKRNSKRRLACDSSEPTRQQLGRIRALADRSVVSSVGRLGRRRPRSKSGTSAA